MSDTPSPMRPTVEARPEDVASPDAIIAALYDCISGPAGSRNWARLKTLYLPEARLIPVGKRMHRDADFSVLTLAQWIEDARPYMAENDFYEKEVMRHSDRFGRIIQAFSTYETRKEPKDEAIARGINSIQLVENEGRWWIASVIWDNESKENPIPGEFTPYLW
ncbi:MAG: hypothetical protein RQ826_04705 [Xanthomonadales bacterium]|nr:hypothetical protein [Xanthomonadales bacterium]